MAYLRNRCSSRDRRGKVLPLYRQRSMHRYT